MILVTCRLRERQNHVDTLSPLLVEAARDASSLSRLCSERLLSTARHIREAIAFLEQVAINLRPGGDLRRREREVAPPRIKPSC